MTRIGAFFDVDGTLTKSDIVTDYVRFRRAVRADSEHLRFMTLLPARLMGVLLLDQVSRVSVNRWTYSWYRGFSAAELRAWALRFQAGAGLARVFPGGLELLRLHAEAGHRIVFISGSLDIILQPLVTLLEARLPRGTTIRLEAVRLVEENGRFTGAMCEPPLGQAEKARRIERVANEEDLDLSSSFAYGDSIADLPALEVVGRPAAVNAGFRLTREARKRGWPLLDLELSQ